MAEKIANAMAEKFSAITNPTDAFPAKQRNEEYRQMIHLGGVTGQKAPIAVTSPQGACLGCRRGARGRHLTSA